MQQHCQQLHRRFRHQKKRFSKFLPQQKEEIWSRCLLYLLTPELPSLKLIYYFHVFLTKLFYFIIFLLFLFVYFLFFIFYFLFFIFYLLFFYFLFFIFYFYFLFFMFFYLMAKRNGFFGSIWLLGSHFSIT